jgi:uncharacterized damage-inducible protein DinB/ketosteroid isomerase-like protein
MSDDIPFAALIDHPDPEIVALEIALRRAQLDADVDALERLLADDLLFTGPDGQLVTKAQDLTAHTSGAVRFRRHDVEELRVRRIADGVALCALRTHLTVEVAGFPVDGRYHYSRMWVRAHDASWRVAGGHVSVLQAAPTAKETLIAVNSETISTTAAIVGAARAFESWQDYQDALIRAVAPLTSAQLAQRPVAGRRSPGELSAHIVFGRALHLHRALGDAANDVRPYVAWDDEKQPRTAAEIVTGLELTWRVIEQCVHGNTSEVENATESHMMLLQYVWGMLDHDLPHAGQLSVLLRATGLPGVDI